MRPLKLTGIIMLISLAGGSLIADSVITGWIVDGDSHPLEAVSVVSNISGFGTATDADGRYILMDARGITRLTFSSVGYHSVQYRASELPDTIKLERLYYRGEDILVTSDRAVSGISPIAFANFSQADIERDYQVGEFPLLLSSTPNFYSYSDGGAPLGYSYVRIRGFDDKRVITYINGVPLNDPEDQATYFVDLPDFASGITDIQVQRGVGNSLYGDASFGGTINVVTTTFNKTKGVVLTSGYGEFSSNGKTISDIYKQSVEYSSGLVDGRWAFSGRFSRQKTGGYRHNSWYEGWAYNFSMARIDPNMTTQFHIYGGPIRMHLAFWGSDRETIADDRRANPLTYDNETDNFNQPHYQLHNNWRLSEKISLKNTLYYIRGKGFYEQFKDNRSFFEYNIDPTVVAFDTSTGQPFQNGDLVRQQWVEKNQLGWNPRLDISHDKGYHAFGGSFYYFESDHWGQVVWSENISGSLNPRHRYYQYFGEKRVASAYAQEYYRLNEQLSVQVTGQLRYQNYSFDQKRIGAFIGHQYDVDWLFFSPRIGVIYQIDEGLDVHANFAVASRTPTDAAIYDANDPSVLPSLEIKDVRLSSSGDTTAYIFGDPTAASERVYDLELGAGYHTERMQLGVDLFWMDFQDEIIPYGGLNQNTGQPITINAQRSVHAGIELTGKIKVNEFTFSSDFSYNYNRIKDFVTDLDGFSIDFKNKTVPGFPDYLGNIFVDFDNKIFRATYRLRLVGQQYMELFNIDSLTIGSYTVSSLSFAYRLPVAFADGKLVLSVRVDNLFNKLYESSGYGGNYAFAGSFGDPVVGGWAEYYVAAERSFFTQLRLELF